MKQRIAYTVFALLILGIAGIAWAAQPAADQAEQVVATTPDAAPAPNTGDLIPSDLDLLLAQPTATGACCWADCRTERNTCLDGCPPVGDPGWEACFDGCNNTYIACTNNC